MGSLETGKGDSLRDATRCLDMVVFDEHAIAQIEAVVVSSTQANRFFFQATQSGCGLAGVEYSRTGSLERAGTLRCEAGDTGEVSQEIQSDTFGA